MQKGRWAVVWVTRDHIYTCSVTSMLPTTYRQLLSHMNMLPSMTPSPRQSRHNLPLYLYTEETPAPSFGRLQEVHIFPRSVIHWNTLTSRHVSLLQLGAV